MAYNILDIEGIGITYGAKLNNLGIKNTEDLLLAGRTKTGREKLSKDSGLDEKLILTWVNHSDLMRINGIGGQISELLEAAGVNTVKEFAGRNAENLHIKLLETNEQFGVSGKVPSVEALKEMIAEAKSMEPAIFY